jgi:hypothetical protein
VIQRLSPDGSAILPSSDIASFSVMRAAEARAGEEAGERASASAPGPTHFDAGGAEAPKPRRGARIGSPKR